MELIIKRVYSDHIPSSSFYVSEELITDKRVLTYKKLFFTNNDTNLLSVVIEGMRVDTSYLREQNNCNMFAESLQMISFLDDSAFKSSFTKLKQYNILKEVADGILVSKLLKKYMICDQVFIRQKAQGSIIPFRAKIQVSMETKELFYKKALVIQGDKDFDKIVFPIELLK